MDLETPSPAASEPHPVSAGYVVASQLALAGQPEAALTQSSALEGADGLRLLARVLLGRHRERIPLGPLPRIPDLDPAAQFDLAHRLVAVAHIERDAFLHDGDLVVSNLLKHLLPRDFGGPDPDTFARHAREQRGRLTAGTDTRDLVLWVSERLALPYHRAEHAVLYLLAHRQSTTTIRQGVETTRLAPALCYLNLATDIVERLELHDLARHLEDAFSYPPAIPTPDLDGLPIEERYDLLFDPQLFDSEVRAARDQDLWLLLHADGFLDHPVVRARRAEFLIWAEDDDEALALVDGVEHPLARAMYVKALVNIAYDGGGFPASFYRDARAIAESLREYADSKDPLECEATMHALEMLGFIAYYHDQDPETAALCAARSLHVAEELGMVDKAGSLQSQVKASRDAFGIAQSDRDDISISESVDARRQELHAVVRLKSALKERHNGQAAEVAESYLGATHIPLLVKALHRYSELDYWGVGGLLHEAKDFRSDFHVFKALLVLQTFVRVGEVAYANPVRALDDFGQHLGSVRAPFEVLAEARSIVPLGLLLAAAIDRARSDVRREAEQVPVMRLSSEGRSGTWNNGKQVAVVPPGVLRDIYVGEVTGDRPFEYFARLAEQRNPFSNKDDLRRLTARHERVGIDWRACVPEITLYRGLLRLEALMPDAGFGKAARRIEQASPELLTYLS